MATPSAPAIYARISLDTEGDGKGVQRQLEDCRKLIADRGWPEGTEYVDNDISAYSGKLRPEYERMLADIESGDVDAVVCYNLDRLTRQPKEFERFNDAVRAAGISNVVFVTGGMDLGTDDGLLIGRIYAAVAAQESATKSRRQRRKNDERAAAGLPHGPTRAFGYDHGNIDVLPDEAAVIVQCVDRFLAGESMPSLVRWLQESGIRTSRGGPWKSTSLRGILTSARIAGLRVHRGEIVGRGVWAPIITPEVRDKVLAEAERRQVSGRRANRSYLLSGLLRCALCDCTLYSARRTATRRYVCQSGPDHGGCGKISIVADPAERLLSAAVLFRLDTGELAERLEKRAAQHKSLSGLREAVVADREQLEELAEAYADRKLKMTEWLTARKRIEARLSANDRRLQRAATNGQLAGLAGHGATLRPQWQTFNLARQTAIVKTVLDHAVISPGKLGATSLDPNRVLPVWRV